MVEIEIAAAARDKFHAWQTASDIESASSPPSSGSVTAEWSEVQGPVAREIARRARTADLTVVARTGRQYAIDSDQTLQGALWESGRPVLLVPGESKAGLFDTVVIAWNDSREAAHAVSAAWSLIAVIFINMLGFGIIVPLLPFYAKSFDAPAWQIALIFSVIGAIVGEFLGASEGLGSLIVRRPPTNLLDEGTEATLSFSPEHCVLLAA